MKSKAHLARALSISIMASFILFGSICLESEDAEAMGSPWVEVDVYQERVGAYMNEAPSVELNLNGTVSAQVPWSPDRQMLEITLRVETEGYNWNFDPPTLTFENGGERTQPFDLILSVPKTVPSGESTVEIGGYWRYSPGTLGGTVHEDTVILEISPYEDGVLGSPLDSSLKEGEETSIPLVVTNTGNTEQYYLIQLEGEKTLENVGVDIDILDMGQVMVEIGESEKSEILLFADDISSERTYYLTVKLLDMETHQEYDSATISVDVRKADKKEEPNIIPDKGNTDDVPSDDGGNIDPTDDPVDDGTSSSSSGSKSSPALFYFIGIVLVIGVLATAGVIFVSRSR